MTREEMKNVFARFMLNENVPLESVKEAILCAIKDMHKMIEIENIVGKEDINNEKVFDVISRERALEPYKDLNADDVISVWLIKKNINELPSVTQKSGKWQVVSDGYGDSAYICECSECKNTVWVYKNADRKWKFCPNCGARMVEPQESEDKE